MSVIFTVKKHIVDSMTYSTGEVVFIDGETLSGNFDTIGDPINLSMFSHGELRLKLEEKTGSPVIKVSIGAVDHLTGEYHEQEVTQEITSEMIGNLLIGKQADSFIGSRMAMKITLSGGSFKVTVTGEFKK